MTWMKTPQNPHNYNNINIYIYICKKKKIQKGFKVQKKSVGGGRGGAEPGYGQVSSVKQKWGGR